MYKSHTVGWMVCFQTRIWNEYLTNAAGKKKNKQVTWCRVCKGAVAAFLSDIVVALDPVSVHQLRGWTRGAQRWWPGPLQTQSNCDTYLQTMEIDLRPTPPPDLMVKPLLRASGDKVSRNSLVFVRKVWVCTAADHTRFSWFDYSLIVRGALTVYKESTTPWQRVAAGAHTGA